MQEKAPLELEILPVNARCYLFQNRSPEPTRRGIILLMIRFVKDREIYEQVIRDRVPLAKKRLWIATADIKDMYADFDQGF